MRMSGGAKWDVAADVVVLGAGAAGIAAAIEAASTGAETLLVEKERSTSQSATVISGGAISFAGTDLQAERGIHDSGELFFSDLQTVGRAKNDVALLETFIALQLETYEWLKKHGTEFRAVTVAAGMSVPRAHITRIGRTMGVLAASAERMGVRFRFDTRAERLITDETGRVAGLRLCGPEGQVLVGATKGVILATGGFGHSSELLSLTPLDMSKVRNFTAKSSTGDGLKMALELGAGFGDLPYVRPTFGVSSNSDGFNDILLANYAGAIIVNTRGARFVDESLPYKEIGASAVSQPRGVGVMIFDGKVREVLERHRPGYDARVRRLCREASTLEELAAMVDLPQEVLLATVQKYNGYVEQHDDPELGRRALAGPVGELVRLDTPPYYAFEAVGALVGTYAGLTIDTKTRVKNVFGEVIPGLHAAGEIMAGFHGAGYMTGTALAKAFVFGRIAGREASA
jgi:flavocytochrome c